MEMQRGNRCITITHTKRALAKWKLCKGLYIMRKEQQIAGSDSALPPLDQYVIHLNILRHHAALVCKNPVRHRTEPGFPGFVVFLPVYP